MATYPWPGNVVNGKKLKVALSGALPANGWQPALKAAVQFLNRELNNNRVALEFEIIAKAINAHVVLEGVPGNEILGRAELAVGGRRGGREYLSDVTIKVPATPRVVASDPKSRIVGDGVKTCILVHEMIHGVAVTEAIVRSASSGNVEKV